MMRPIVVLFFRIPLVAIDSESKFEKAFARAVHDLDCSIGHVPPFAKQHKLSITRHFSGLEAARITLMGGR